MRRRLIGSVLGALLVVTALASTALGAPGPTVTIRIEGESETLLPRTRVTTSTAPVPNSGCSGTSVAGAIEVATNGNWDRQEFTQEILDETHSFARNDYWAEWLNNRYGNGICNDELNEGDDVVMLVDFSGSNFEPTIFPVRLGGVPRSVGSGEPFTVTVTEFVSDGSPGSGTPTPVAGAEVSGGGTSATTDTQGRATLSMPSGGRFTLRAVKSSRARSAAEPVCVDVCGPSTGTGPGGTTEDGEQSTEGSALPAGASGGPPGRLLARLIGLPALRRYPAALAPRLLRGTVSTGGARLRAVRMRLRRYDRGRCQHYSVRLERFHDSRCLLPYFWYTITDRASWSYLLPARLPNGFYRLETEALDALGRRSRAASVFFVLSR